jgi:hypothetical protein
MFVPNVLAAVRDTHADAPSSVTTLRTRRRSAQGPLSWSVRGEALVGARLAPSRGSRERGLCSLAGRRPHRHAGLVTNQPRLRAWDR